MGGEWLGVRQNLGLKLIKMGLGEVRYFFIYVVLAWRGFYGFETILNDWGCGGGAAGLW